MQRHAVTGHCCLLRPLVSTRFQVLFHSLPGYFSPFPHGTSSLSVAKEYLALRGWSPRVPTGFPVPAVLRYLSRKAAQFRVRDCYPLWSGFPSGSAITHFVTSRPAGRRIKPGPTTPNDNDCRLSHRPGLGSSLFARHYSGSRGFFPFLRVLRCFSSPACLLMPYVFRHGYARITTRGVSSFGDLRIKVGQHLPRLIAAAHVLHRLLAPRHPPCALILLIEKNMC